MGTKCTCLNHVSDNQTCDLSNTSNVPVMNNTKNLVHHSNINDVTNNNIAISSMIHPEVKTELLKSKSQNKKKINEKQVKLLEKNIRGFLLRRKYKTKLRKEFENFADVLYNKFINEIAVNINVNNALYKPPSSNYITVTTWSSFYTSDPTSSYHLSSENHYKDSILIEYKDKSFHSDDIETILSNALSLYKGEVLLRTNIKDGTGELTYRNGSQLYGTWYNDSFTGWNRKIDIHGTLFIGLFINGILNGKGILFSHANNHLYKGDFKNGLREGEGIDESSGNKYIGTFVADKKCGKGKITFESGDVYEGEFSNNKFNGNGHYKWKNGHEYIGEYHNGIFHGKGLYKWSEKGYYKGDYNNGVKEGNGEIKYEDGKKFICPFVKGKPNGIGMYEDGKGNKTQVELIDGKINKKFKPSKKKL